MFDRPIEFVIGVSNNFDGIGKLVRSRRSEWLYFRYLRIFGQFDGDCITRRIFGGLAGRFVENVSISIDFHWTETSCYATVDLHNTSIELLRR